ncbi:HD domain-containing protein, partial [Singulisphaera rosea]
AVDPAYFESLSPASKRSLELQGGPFEGDGLRAFESNPFCKDAVRLRHWDDSAKVPGLDVPGLDHYRSRIEGAVLA